MTYTVAPNDTISSIARRFQVPVDELLAYNRLAPNSFLTPGMIIIIPPKPPISPRPPSSPRPPMNPFPPQNRIYLVRRGDTIWSIARMFGVRAEDIMRINGLRFPVVFPGQRLIIPMVARSFYQ